MFLWNQINYALKDRIILFHLPKLISDILCSVKANALIRVNVRKQFSSSTAIKAKVIIIYLIPNCQVQFIYDIILLNNLVSSKNNLVNSSIKFNFLIIQI